MFIRYACGLLLISLWMYYGVVHMFNVSDLTDDVNIALVVHTLNKDLQIRHDSPTSQLLRQLKWTLRQTPSQSNPLDEVNGYILNEQSMPVIEWWGKTSDHYLYARALTLEQIKNAKHFSEI